MLGCSHRRANYLFTESITAGPGTEFLGWPCHDSWDDFEAGRCCDGQQAAGYVMGEWASERAVASTSSRSNQS